MYVAFKGLNKVSGCLCCKYSTQFNIIQCVCTNILPKTFFYSKIRRFPLSRNVKCVKLLKPSLSNFSVVLHYGKKALSQLDFFLNIENVVSQGVKYMSYLSELTLFNIPLCITHLSLFLNCSFNCLIGYLKHKIFMIF